ncbi:EAL domain-containing protein [Francisellaceae bacterium]|nr:EAL domain-containing protein [Francisellaceae bacterium]
MNIPAQIANIGIPAIVCDESYFIDGFNERAISLFKQIGMSLSSGQHLFMLFSSLATIKDQLLEGQPCLISENDHHFIITLSNTVNNNQENQTLKLIYVLEISNDSLDNYSSLYRNYFHSNSIASYIFTRDGLLIDYNPKCRDLLNLKEYHKGKKVHLYLPEELCKFHQAAVCELSLNQLNFHQQIRISVSGKRFPYIVEMHSILESKADTGLYVVLLINESKLLDQQRSLQSAHALLNRGTDVILTTDHQLRIRFVNHAVKTVFGYEPRELINQHISILSSGKNSKRFYEKMWAQIKKNGYWEGEIWDKAKSGEVLIMWSKISRVAISDNYYNYVASLRNMTRQYSASEQILHASLYDHLTNLPNRALLNNHFSKLLDSDDIQDKTISIVTIDLDYFKDVNDTGGHDIGDLLLIDVASRLKKQCHSKDEIAARAGGDEFILICRYLSEVEFFERCKNIIDELRNPYHIKGRDFYIGASIGFSVYPDDSESFSDLLKYADSALYISKHNGRGIVSKYIPILGLEKQRELDLKTYLNKIITEQDNLHVLYQPQYDYKNNKYIGCEILVRILDDTGTIISPVEFIPVAEKTGLITDLTLLIIKKSIPDIKKIFELMPEQFSVSINLSKKDFFDSNQQNNIISLLEENNIPLSRIELEITESGLFDKIDEANKIFNKLHSKGFQLALDDFGTGFSSLKYLSSFSIDKLKIDKAFVNDMQFSDKAMSVCKCIIDIANALDIKTIAEGVEEKSQADSLLELGCEQLQGFYFSKPVYIDELIKLLRD